MNGVGSRSRSVYPLLSIMAALAGWNCVDEPATELVVSLSDQFDTAVIEVETSRLDLGDDSSRRFLGDGWSWNESSGDFSYVWGVGEASTVEFFVSRVRPIVMRFRCRPFLPPDEASQTVDLSVDAFEIATVALQPGMHEYSVEIPETAIEAGRNRIRIEYGFSASPEDLGLSSDSRPLAVAWDWIGFDLETPRRQPTVDRESRTISIPPGSQLDFYLLARRGDRLAVDSIDDRGPGDAALVVSYRDDESKTEHPIDLRRLQSTGSIELPATSTTPARISLRAPAATDAEREARPTRVQAARITRPAQEPIGPGEDRESEHAGPMPGSTPNILVYLVDTLRTDRLGSYGNDRALTPALDALAAQSLLFEHAIAPSSWTKPSVASILTGRSPFEHGVNHRRHRLDASFSTLAEILAVEGYDTAGFGTNPYLTADSGLQQGFDHFDLSDDRTDAVVDRVSAWLGERAGDRPFFLYVHTVDPHDPYAPPESFRRRFAPSVSDETIGSADHIKMLGQNRESRTTATVDAINRLYDAEVAFADQQFGRLVESLERQGLYDETLIVFVADHGEAFYEHGTMGHGWDLFKEVVEVPLIVRPPGGTSPKRIQSPVQLTDIAPTILNQLDPGTTPSDRGVSLLAWDRAKRSRQDSFEAVPLFSYLDYDERRGISVVLGRWKLIEPISFSFLPERRLIDRDRDPGETENLTEDYPVTAGWLASLARGQLRVLEARQPAESIDFDEKTERRLRALGYID